MLSSKGFPSLAMVVERFLCPPRKRDCRKDDLVSVFELFEPSLLMFVLLPRLLILKKFLIRCGKCVAPLLGLLEFPEKLRFSDETTEVLDEVPKS